MGSKQGPGACLMTGNKHVWGDMQGGPGVTGRTACRREARATRSRSRSKNQNKIKPRLPPYHHTRHTPRATRHTPHRRRRRRHNHITPISSPSQGHPPWSAVIHGLALIVSPVPELPNIPRMLRSAVGGGWVVGVGWVVGAPASKSHLTRFSSILPPATITVPCRVANAMLSHIDISG